MLRDWQKDFIRRVYGPEKTVGGVVRRIVRTALLSMARKNGKTELIAALAIAHLCCEAVAELNGQIYSAAADREQAGQIFNAASAMVRLDPELSAELNVLDSRKRIVHLPSGSFYQAISSESKTKHGFNASVILYDELAQAPDRELWDVLTTSTGARLEPLTFVISVQSKDSTHVMSEQVDYGEKVNRGEIDDPTFVAFIYAIPDEADVFDERNWRLANPALADFRSLEDMREKAQKAKRMPSNEPAFRNLYCNQRSAAVAQFVARSDWQAIEWHIPIEAFAGRECCGGLDLSGKNDLTALVLDAVADDGRSEAFAIFWTPEEGLEERGKRDRVPYAQWVKEGHLRVTPGRSVDYGFVAKEIGELRKRTKLRAIAFDRWRIDDLLRELDDLGIETEIVKSDAEPKNPNALLLMPHGQGFRDMAPAVDVLETAILNRTLRVARNPVMYMCAQNAVCTFDPAGARKFDKRPGKSTGRIDGIVALAQAVHCAGGAPKPRGPSVYETRGVLVL